MIIWRNALGVAWRCALCVLVVCAFAAFPSARAEAPPVLYFYQNYCASCDPRAEFYGTFASLTGESLDGYRYEAYDVQTPSGEAAMEKILTEFGVKASEARLPMVVYDGRLYSGQEQLEAELPAYVIREGGSAESFFYYLSVDSCASCANVQSLLDALPGAVQVRRGVYAFDSAVRYENVNILKEAAKATALFDAFAVPEEKRVAPILLAGDGHYQGEKAIASFLKYSLPAGRAIGTKVVEVPTGMVAWVVCAGVGALLALGVVWYRKGRKETPRGFTQSGIVALKRSVPD